MHIVCLLFEQITALDAVGPYEVLARLPAAKFTFVGSDRGAVRTDNGVLGMEVDAALEEVQRCDVLLVPGGFGVRRLARDPQMVSWLRAVDQTTRITASVCTGSLLLGAAGLLRGRRATTHWAYLEELREHGALPVSERIVRDGKYASSAGVSAGIDLALALAHELAGQDMADAIQLGIEYDPAPPRAAGRPDQVAPAIRDAVRARIEARTRMAD